MWNKKKHKNPYVKKYEDTKKAFKLQQVKFV